MVGSVLASLLLTFVPGRLIKATGADSDPDLSPFRPWNEFKNRQKIASNIESQVSAHSATHLI